MKLHSAYIRAITAVAAGVFVVGLWFSGIDPEFAWLRVYSISIFVTLIAWNCWEKWLWRLPFLRRVSVVPPSLIGTWKGVFESERNGTREAYLVVRQTFSRVRVELLSSESESRSSLAQINRDEGLSYTYMNYPRDSAPKTSNIHRGTAILKPSGTPVNALRGRYFTDRGTKGELEFEQRISNLADDFEMAQRLFL